MVRPALCAALVSVLALTVHAENPQEILAKAKVASGGAAWDTLRSARTKAAVSAGGLHGTNESLDDLTTGRYVDRFQLGPVTGAQGYDGAVVWSQDGSGQSRADEGGDGRLGAVDESYRRAYGYWHPDRWPAQIEDAGAKEEGGRKFLVLRITPKGGRPFDLWFDAATLLVDRVVEKSAMETRTTTLSDYRSVGGVKVPFSARSTNGDARFDQVATVQSVEFNVPIDDAAFKMPAPPPPDFAFSGGKTSTTVPFELINNHIYVEVRLNGKGPYRLMCDTGGANVVTPELARELGLASEGAFEARGVGEKSEDYSVTKIAKLEIGDVAIENQVFMVYALGPYGAIEGVPQLGLVGYEVFKRFVATVNYEKKLLTLTLPSAFEYHGTGTVVPFTFNGHIPQVEGSLDGVAGKFDLDTGARNAVSILAPFAEQHGLKERYGATVAAVTGWGVGGPSRGLVTRARTLKLGAVEVSAPVVDLSLQKKGALSDPYVAGNVGAGVLKRFNVTFDYARQRVIFEPNANYAKPDPYDRSGMWINLGAAGFEVVALVPGGPAETAGLKVGDQITAVAGTPSKQLTLPDLRQRLRTEPAGTALQLTVLRDGKESKLKLVLRELVPGGP